MYIHKCKQGSYSDMCWWKLVLFYSSFQNFSTYCNRLLLRWTPLLLHVNLTFQWGSFGHVATNSCCSVIVDRKYVSKHIRVEKALSDAAVVICRVRHSCTSLWTSATWFCTHVLSLLHRCCKCWWLSLLRVVSCEKHPQEVLTDSSIWQKSKSAW